MALINTALERTDQVADQVKLVQDSFKKKKVGAAIATQAANLLDRLFFGCAPEVKPLFPANLATQKQKLMTMIGTAVEDVATGPKIVPAVQDLGRRHATYGSPRPTTTIARR